MTADDNVHTPRRIQNRCQLLVLLKADMRQQNREIYIYRIISIADAANLLRRLADINEGADIFLHPRMCKHLLRNDTDKKNLHSVKLGNIM